MKSTQTLLQVLTATGRRKTVIADCVVLIDEEVAKKTGLTGLTIKGAFAVVKALKPGFIAEAVDNLLDDFAARLDPFYQAVPAGRSLPAHFVSQGSPIAEALLGITDERAQRAQNQTARKAYDKLRPTAKKHVEAAVPGIARLVEKHTAEAAA